MSLEKFGEVVVEHRQLAGPGWATVESVPARLGYLEGLSPFVIFLTGQC